MDYEKVVIEGLRRNEQAFQNSGGTAIAGILYRDAVKHVTSMMTAKAEAERLFDALHGQDWWHVTRYIQQNPPSPAAIGFLILVARDRFKSQAQRDHAFARAATYGPAKTFAIEAWEKDKNEYKGKADFARVNGPIIRRKFSLDVKDRTIERDWLPKGR